MGKKKRKKSTKTKHLKTDKQIQKLCFNITKTIDFNNDDEVIMISFCVAYNDLRHFVLAMMKEQITKHPSFQLYLFKIVVAQTRDIYQLLRKFFQSNSNYAKSLEGNPEIYSRYAKLFKQAEDNNSDSFVKQVLSPARHLTSHYRFKDKDKKYLQQVAYEMESRGMLGEINIGNRKADYYFKFADELFISTLATFGEDFPLNESEYFKKLSILIMEIIDLLFLIIEDYMVVTKHIYP